MILKGNENEKLELQSFTDVDKTPPYQMGKFSKEAEGLDVSFSSFEKLTNQPFLFPDPFNAH